MKIAYHTQGGGTATWDEFQECWRFYEPAEGFEPDDRVPEEWGIQPVLIEEA